MNAESDIHDRIRRAESEPMTLTEVDTDPLVLNVYNEQSDRYHTVVPESLHCSCEDHQYRNVLCKHLCAVALSDDVDIIENALLERQQEINAEIDDLEDERDQVLALMEELGVGEMSIQPATSTGLDSVDTSDFEWGLSSSTTGETFEFVDPDEEDHHDEGLDRLVDDLVVPSSKDDSSEASSEEQRNADDLTGRDGGDN